MWVDYKPINVEMDDDNTGVFHVFEMWIGQLGGVWNKALSDF